MINVLKYGDLAKIEQFFRDGEYDNGNIEVVMYVETQERLNKLNLEYFRLNNKPTVKYKQNVDTRKINIQIGRVKFTYKLRENDKDS